ncbi:MAG: hypothetical protein ABSA32_15420, partial [Candidatus Acidiferrales bacterium]
ILNPTTPVPLHSRIRGRTFSLTCSSFAEQPLFRNAASGPFYNHISNIFSGAERTPQALNDMGLALTHCCLANAHIPGDFSFCGSLPEELTHNPAVRRAQLG